MSIDKYVIDKEMNDKGYERIGYTVDYDEEIKCYGVSFKDEPHALYWMDEKQLQLIEYNGKE